MKEIINLPGPSTKLIDSPIPSINDDQVLIKVVVSGSNPKDWKVAELANDPNSFLYSRYEHVREGVNQGDDIAGVIEKVGKNVVEFKVYLTQLVPCRMRMLNGYRKATVSPHSTRC